MQTQGQKHSVVGQLLLDGGVLEKKLNRQHNSATSLSLYHKKIIVQSTSYIINNAIRPIECLSLPQFPILNLFSLFSRP
jgi:hypothetical protein